MDNTTNGQRPTFLTVLCIISFLWAAYGLYQSAKSAFTDAPIRELEEARLQAEADMAELEGPALEMAGPMIESSLEMLQKSVDNAEPIGYTGLLQGVLTLLGVWMMWGLRKLGFWLYAGAGAIGLVSMVLFFGTSGAAMVALLVMGFLTILFIVLYAIHLKYMN
ncbi:MAG: hypothetical protein R2817_07910 [Flavobacteriales bacterium]